MTPHNRLTSLLIEMAGSAAVCGVAYAAERLIGAHRRRSSRA
jgi:hypothetical protein